MARVLWMVCVGMMLVGSQLFAQGYYISARTELPPEYLLCPAQAMPVSVNREDVKAIGMGRAQVAFGATFTALTYNPALLSRERFALEVPSVQASLPTETYDAVLFLQKNMREFEDALFLSDIQRSIDAFENAADDAQRLKALQSLQESLRFPRDLLNTVIGPSTSPKTHGVLVIPAVTAQVGHWGFSLHANLQSGFQVVQSATVEALAGVDVPVSLNDRAGVARALTQLTAVLQTVTTENGSFSLEDALPKAFAVSYLDLVGTVGYGTPVTERLSLGGAFKIVNRRFSNKRVAADNFDEILSAVRHDFTESITGLTLDVGALYTFPGSGTDVGISLQNIIPFRTIRSTRTAAYASTSIALARTASGDIITNAAGDTALVVSQRTVRMEAPLDLKLPFLIHIGARQPITPEWDIAVDITDLTAGDVRYENYLDRVRIGMEYRVGVLEGKLGMSGRLGMADRQWTLGIGVNIFRVLQLDAAYAHDSYVNTRSYFLQARLGW